MRLSLIFAALLAACAPALAADSDESEPVVPGNGVAQPLSGNPGWRAQAAVGGGVVMINAAGGQHYLTPEATVQGSWRANRLLTYRSRLDFATRKDGTDEIFVENTYSWLTFRPEGTLGTDRTQFVFGLGPSMILTTTRLHGPGRNVHANSFRLGFEYSIGMRWMVGNFPMGIDFGGQQRETRHDFRTTMVFGIPLVKSPASNDAGKGAIR